MRARHAPRPSLEGLEDRLAPATLRAAAGVLLVTNPAGPLTVQTLAPGVINVTDSAGSATVRGIGRLIAVMGTNAGDRVTFRANAAPFGGGLVINTLNGPDVVDLGGRVGGDVTVLPGLGNDAVLSTGGDVRVGGNLTIADTAGSNSWRLGGRNVTVGKDLTVYGEGAVVMGGGNTLQVGGFASLTALQPVAGSLSLALDGAAVNVGKTLSVQGGSLGNTVSVTSMLSVGGNLFVSLGTSGGTNTFRLTPAAGGTGVTGNLSYTGGAAGDNVLLGAAIGGSATFDLGNGADTFTDDPGTTYGGDLTIRGGNDASTLSINGAVAGGLTVDLGNGTDLVTVTTLPAGTLRFRGGNGADTLRLRGAGAYNVDALFGTGDNTLDIDAGLVLSGTVRGSGGNNAFIQGAGQLQAPIALINFP